MRITLLKDSFRSVARNKLRFISVVIIVALGISFYVGIKSASPKMNSTANSYFNSSNLADVRVTSRIPFSDRDINRIYEFDGVEKIIKSRFVDALASVDGRQIVDGNGLSMSCRIEEFNAEKAKKYSETGEADESYINRLNLIDGRYPEAAGECVIDSRAAKIFEGIGIGAVIKLNGDGASVTDTLKSDELKIVGTVDSPLYISSERGSSQVGSGSLSAFIYADSASFSTDDCNEIYVKIADSDKYDKFSTAYNETVTMLADSIQSISAEMIDSKISDIKAEYKTRISDKEKELSDYRVSSEKALADKKKEIDEFKAYVDSEDEILEKEKTASENAKKSAKSSLDSVSKQFETLTASYDSNVAEYDGSSQKISGYSELKKLYDDLNDKHKSDKKNLNSLESKKKDALESLESVREKVTEAENSVKSCESKISSLEADISSLKSDISSLETDRKNQESKISSVESEISSLQTRIDELEAQDAIEPLGYTELKELRTAKTSLQSKKSELTSARSSLNDIVSRISSKESSLKNKNSDLDAAKNSLPSFKNVLISVKGDLSVAQTSYDGAKANYDTAKKSYDADTATLDKYKQSMDDLTSGQTELLKLQNTIETQKNQIEELKVSLTVAQIRYSLAVRNGGLNVQKAQTELNNAKSRYYSIDEEYTNLKNETDKNISNLQGDIKMLKNTLKNVESIRWSATAQTNLSGHRSFITSMENINQMSTIFPLIFLFTAMVASFVIMLKNVEDERNSIGLFKAFGYSDLQIVGKYVLYSSLAWLFGSIIGIVVGACIFPSAIYSIYGSVYSIPDINIAFNLKYIARGLAVSFATTTAASCIATFKELRHQPAELLRPKMISYNRRSVIEMIPSVWMRMSYGMILLVRTLSRSRKRVIVGTLAIACCTALIVSAFGLLNSATDVKSAQYGKNGIFRYDIQFVLNAEQFPEDSVTVDKLSRDKNVVSSMLVSEIAYDVSATNSRWDGFDTAYVVVPQSTDMLPNYVYFSRVSGNLDFSGAVISEKLADDLELKTGSTVYFTDNDGNVYSTSVTGIVKNYIDHYVYLSSDAYSDIFGKAPEYKYIISILKDYLTENEIAKLSADYIKTDEVVGAKSSDALANSVDISINQVLALVIMFVLSACILASIVMYTISNVNISERTHEIANIKVIGFSDGEVLIYIVRENIVSTAIGIAVGLVGGVFLHKALVNYISVANVMYGSHIFWWSYILSALLIAAVAFAAAIPILIKINRINMPETLKAIE